MADKAISELVAASQVKPADLFVLEQDGAAKKLTGQTLENWLLTLADGHGGIQSITKTGTSGLKDTYRITLADETYQDIQVTNGRGITGFAKTGTSGLVDTWRVSYNDGTHTDISVTNGRGITKNELVSTSGLVKTYRITYNDGTTQTYTVTDGAKGDKGDNTYTHVKYASQEPTAASHSMGDVPDAWMGIYTGALATAPTDWTLYKWNKVKGEQGDTGSPAQIASWSVTYLASDRGDIVPSGSWSTTIPTVAQGKYLWTRVITTFNSGSPVTSYSVSRMGIDGTGSVSSVNSQNPDSTGNVKLTAADIAGSDGQSVEAALAGKQAKITSVGLLKGTGNGGVTDAVAGVDYQAPITAGAGIKLTENKISTAAAPRNWLDNSDFTNLVAQAGIKGKHGSIVYLADRWILDSGTVEYHAGTGITLNGTIKQSMERVPTDASCFVGAKTGTASIKMDGHTVTITSAGGTIEWAAVYDGTYTPDTMPAYTPKGISDEKASCMRYFVDVSRDPGAIGYISAANTAYVMFSLPQKMRVNPSVTIADGGTSRIWCKNQTYQVYSYTLMELHETGATYKIVTEGGMPVGEMCQFYASKNIALNADM